MWPLVFDRCILITIGFMILLSANGTKGFKVERRERATDLGNTPVYQAVPKASDLVHVRKPRNIFISLPFFNPFKGWGGLYGGGYNYPYYYPAPYNYGAYYPTYGYTYYYG